MWRNVGPRVAQLSPLERVRLRRVAVRYAAHGWEVHGDDKVAWCRVPYSPGRAGRAAGGRRSA